MCVCVMKKKTHRDGSRGLGPIPVGPNPQPVVRFLFIYLFLLTSIINERGWVILWVKGGLRSFSRGLLIVPKVRTPLM